MHYFAYGSNMSRSRLRERAPSAEALGCFALNGYDLGFHKSGKDGSAKCDAYFTADTGDVIYGVLVGAREASLPSDYIRLKITSVEAVEDSDKERDSKQRAIHS